MGESTEAHAEVAPPKRAARSILIRVAGLFREGSRELSIPREHRIPFLDGLRSIAVLLVMNEHISGTFAKFHGGNFYARFPLTSAGWSGVDLFFVLSGFFIGSQLWKELDRTGTISIGNFMIRRGLRIWPLYFFMFFVVSIASPGAAASKQHGWADVVFLTNYLPHGIVLGSWSLCSEEQFYLLAPLSLFLIGKRSMKGYRTGLIGLFGLEVIVRAISYWHLSGHIFARDPAAFHAIYFPFHTHCDGLIAGLIISNIVASKPQHRWKVGPWTLVATAFVVFVATTLVQREILYFAGFAILFASLVWLGVKNGPHLFDSYPFYLLSRLSFGMYLNHEYMGTWIVSKAVPAIGLMHLGPVIATAASFVILTVISVALSAATFCMIEHPFLVLRTALLRRRVVTALVAH